MGQVAYLRNIASKAQHLLFAAGQRWIDAIGKAQAGTLTANEVAQNIVQTAADATDSWLSLLQAGGDPVLPNINLTASAANLKNPSSASGYLREALKPAAPFSFTNPMVLLGQGVVANPIQLAVSFPSTWREEIKA